MNADQCWIAYVVYQATGEGMTYVLSIASSAARATQLFDERSNDFFRGSSTTAPLLETLQRYSGLREVIPEEVLHRTCDVLCWKLEYFGTFHFNCA